MFSQWCSLVYCGGYTLSFLTYTYSMHPHKIESILKVWLCVITMSVYYKQHKILMASDIYTCRDLTDFLLFTISLHQLDATFSLRCYVNTVPGAQV